MLLKRLLAVALFCAGFFCLSQAPAQRSLLLRDPLTSLSTAPSFNFLQSFNTTSAGLTWTFQYTGVVSANTLYILAINNQLNNSSGATVAGTSMNLDIEDSSSADAVIFSLLVSAGQTNPTFTYTCVSCSGGYRDAFLYTLTNPASGTVQHTAMGNFSITNATVTAGYYAVTSYSHQSANNWTGSTQPSTANEAGGNSTTSAYWATIISNSSTFNFLCSQVSGDAQVEAQYH